MEKVLLYSILFSFAIATCSATTYIVGDNSGWDISTNLDTWVADKKFNIGDVLRKLYCLGGMKLHVHVEGDDKSLAPAQAPKAVAGSDKRTDTLPESPSSKKNTHFSNGVANFATDALQLVYIALMATVYGLLQQI
ncbi:Cupredoxin [Sesbania bispinosa]|nr:Cupredoxin [Sesbania bispinosa]